MRQCPICGEPVVVSRGALYAVLSRGSNGNLFYMATDNVDGKHSIGHLSCAEAEKVREKERELPEQVKDRGRT